MKVGEAKEHTNKDSLLFVPADEIEELQHSLTVLVEATTRMEGCGAHSDQRKLPIVDTFDIMNTLQVC